MRPDKEPSLANRHRYPRLRRLIAFAFVAIAVWLPVSPVFEHIVLDVLPFQIGFYRPICTYDSPCDGQGSGCLVRESEWKERCSLCNGHGFGTPILRSVVLGISAVPVEIVGSLGRSSFGRSQEVLHHSRAPPCFPGLV